MNKTPETMRWTPAAIHCYERNCRCDGCIYNERLETKCLMKHTVLELFAKYGKPKDISLKIRKKQKFITGFYGPDVQKIKLLKKMKEVKYSIYNQKNNLTELFADVLNIVSGLILHERQEEIIKELQDMKLSKETNLIYQKKFRDRKNSDFKMNG